MVIPPETTARIDKIISETAALVATLQDPPKTQLGAEVQQEMQAQMQQEQEQQQQQRMKTKLDVVSHFVFAQEEYDPKEDSLEAIFAAEAAAAKHRYQVLKLPECVDIEQPSLRFCPVHFAVTQNKQKSEIENAKAELEQLKPIKMLLMKIAPDDNMQFLACTAAGAEYYSFLMNNEVLTAEEPAYAIITTEGAILQVSNNLSLSRCEKLVAKPDCQQMLTYAHFLNGKISNPIILSQIIAKHGWDKDKYTRLANAVASVHVSQHSVSLLHNATLEKFCAMSNSAVPSYNAPEQTTMQQTLRPVTTLGNHMKGTDLPMASPKRALEGYLFNESPQAVPNNTDKLALTSILKKNMLITNANNSDEKNHAINKLNKLAISIVNSLQTTEEKARKLNELYVAFKAFDQKLSACNSALQKCKTGIQTSPDTFKGVALKAIARAYENFANDIPLSKCIADLQSNLFILDTEVKRASELQNGKRSRFFQTRTSRSSGQQLSDVLQKVGSRKSGVKS